MRFFRDTVCKTEVESVVYFTSDCFDVVLSNTDICNCKSILVFYLKSILSALGWGKVGGLRKSHCCHRLAVERMRLGAPFKVCQM